MMEQNYINFRPHIGKYYYSNGYRGKRILILGESHYCIQLANKECKGYPLCKAENMKDVCYYQTEKEINKYLHKYDGSSYLQTFLCFERSILGKVLTQEEKEEFWEGVLFYNYLQFDQQGPRLPIPYEYWNHSEKAFRQLLETYLPDYIIEWGVRLYNNTPNWDGTHSLLTVNGDSTDVWTYKIKGKQIPMLKVHHPSAPTGKNWEYWHQFIKVFLQL